MSITTILVPYDFSDCATDALRVAAKIARLTGATIDVVHLYEQMTDFHTENQRVREEIEVRLEQVPSLAFVKGLELRKFLLRQMSLSEMFKNERLAAVDLVVMGTHGARGLRGIVGSNTQRIVRQAPMPVLVIKSHSEDFEIRDVVYASNFSAQDVDKFDSFHPLLSLFDARVHLLKVNTPKTFERSEDSHKAIDAFLRRYELKKSGGAMPGLAGLLEWCLANKLKTESEYVAYWILTLDPLHEPARRSLGLRAPATKP